MILEVEFHGVALAHAYEGTGNRAAEGPEGVGDAFGHWFFDFEYFEIDDHVGRLFSLHRRRHFRRAG